VFSLFLEIFATKFCDIMSLSHFLRHVGVTTRGFRRVVACASVRFVKITAFQPNQSKRGFVLPQKFSHTMLIKLTFFFVVGCV